MNDEALWKNVIDGLSSTGEELQTKTGLWFKALSEKERLYVDRALNHPHSSKITTQRPISEKEFLYVYSYYDRWLNKEKGIGQKVSQKSMNTAYIFALIKKFKK